MEPVLMGSQTVMSLTELLLAFVVFCLILVAVKSFWRQIPPGLKRLPGPKGYPLIGNILDLGKNPHLSLNQMRQKYGDVMQIRIGTRPILVLSGLETIRQALIKQGEDFASRPNLYSFQFVGEGQSLTFGSCPAEVWRSRRKVAQNALKVISIAANETLSTCPMEEFVSTEADSLVVKFQELMKEKNSFEPYRYLVVSVANVICGMCFGKRYDHEDQELLSLVNINNEFGEAAASCNPADFIPLLQYLPNQTMKVFKDLNKRFGALVERIAKEHYTTFDKNNIRDITDSLIDYWQSKKVDVNANIQQLDQNIVHIVGDIFGAGFDTVSTGLSWCLMYLVTYPEIQKKIQDELDQNIGRERKARLSDRNVLPYTEAFILEMFRHSSFIPFTIPHCTTKDTALNGFYIPKDTCVFVNQWQVNHDPKLWKDPFAFNPERFLAEDGSGINRAEGEKILTFGLGRRRCIGENIGRSEIFLFLTTLVQKLEFSLRPGKEVDFTPQYGLTMKFKKCEHFQIKTRF
ncbi:cytochrome P450 1A5 [Anolis carolinensis]|uniref:cytochrome P450 1A5 n=1 Tax=Anolis carolinensis TaxID=28377 RepID=UPI002F2B3487